VRVHQEHLAAHAPQIGECAAGGKATAIDDAASSAPCIRRADAIVNLSSELKQLIGQRRERRAWIEMRLLVEEQSVLKPLSELGFEGGDLLAMAELPAAAGALGEAA